MTTRTDCTGGLDEGHDREVLDVMQAEDHPFIGRQLELNTFRAPVSNVEKMVTMHCLRVDHST